MTTIDARGRSCPEPVLLTKKALDSGESSYQVLVDNRTAVEDVTRFAKHAGYWVAVAESGEDFSLSLTR